MRNVKTKIYFLAGLCFEKEIFENLTLNSSQINFLNWIEPQKKESLSSYTEKISKQIVIDENEIVLIGHSFGGIIMQEISKIIPVKKAMIRCISVFMQFSGTKI